MIIGANGRMGQSLIRLIQAQPQFTLSAAIGRSDNYLAALDKTDVVIEFAKAEVTLPVARACRDRKIPLVIGSTGHSEVERAEIAEIAKQLPIVFAPNFSVGVNLLFHLVKKAAEILGPDYDQEIVEMHHRRKLDSPSGTARRLGEILAEVDGLSYAEAIAHGRHGMVGPRPSRQIGMHAVRGGDVVGDHTVIFATDGERVELTHKASNRDTFSIGALKAARWLHDRPPGLYTMQDVLNLG